MRHPGGQKGSKSSGSSSLRLLLRAKDGDPDALERLFSGLLPALRRWTHGRLPQWARDGVGTTDVVQDAALNALRGLRRFEPRRRNGLEAYLRQAIQNRIRDLIRQRRRRGGPPDDVTEIDLPSHGSPLDSLIARRDSERYLAGLSQLSSDDQMLIVGRIDLGYDYEQLALVGKRPSPNAARMAVKRAIERLVEQMDATE
jgi:RNA polymerase sigma factor (sigma-70 family)